MHVEVTSVLDHIFTIKPSTECMSFYNVNFKQQISNFSLFFFFKLTYVKIYLYMLV